MITDDAALMFSSLAPLSSERHRAKRLRPVRSWAFAARQAIVPIVGSEVARAATEFPLGFVANGTEFTLVAVLGFEPNRNLFVSPTGQWIASYVPAAIRSYPFAQGRSPDGASSFLCVDEASDLLADAEGEPLFTPEGGPGQPVERALLLLQEIERVSVLQRRLCALLAGHGLIVPWELSVSDQGRSRRVEGLFRIDEERLHALPDPAFLELRKSGVLTLVYAQLLSMGRIVQLQELVKLQARLAPPASSSSSAAAAADEASDYSNATFNFNF